MAKGIYSDMPGIGAKDYVVHYRADRKTWSVDRVGAGGTHTTIGSTRGFGTTEAVRAAIENDAHVKGVRNATVFHNEGDEAGVLKNGRVYFFPGAFANDGYEHRVQEAPRRGAPVDETAAHELVLFIENESDLSPDGPRGQGRDVLLNALRKYRKGTYDPTLAIKLFAYLVESGAKRYAREFGSSEREWSTMFPPATRQEAARQLEASFRNSAEQGEYDRVDTKIGAREARSMKTPSTEPRDFEVVELVGGRWVPHSRNLTRGRALVLVEQLKRKGVQAKMRHSSVAREGREMRAGRSRDRDRPIGMTYGTLPSFEQFERDIRRPDPESRNGGPYWPEGTFYPMELVDPGEILLAEAYGLSSFEPERARTGRNSRVRGFRGDEREIYGFLESLVEEFNNGGEAGGDLASSIMTTLGYEWI